MLKAGVAAAALVFLAAHPATAGTLLTGAIRDRAGTPVAGALVTVFDAAGTRIGTDVALADGTFAVDAQGAPATLEIACRYCRPLRTFVTPGEPVVAIVERYGAVDAAGPTPEDIRALPYRSGPDLASLLPFTTVTGAALADRGLARTGAIGIGGLPFYDPADGSSVTGLLPAHAVASLTATSSLDAPAYGGYAAAGRYDLSLIDPVEPTSRLDAGGGFDLAARVAEGGWLAGYADSVDAGDDRRAANAGANLALGAGRLTFAALDVAGAGDDGAGVGVSYAGGAERYETAASLDATQTGDSALVAFAAGLRDRGPFGVALGVRALRATALVDGTGAAQSDVAVAASAARQAGSAQLAATIAWDHGGDAGSVTSRAAALEGSLSAGLALGARWTLAAGALSNLRIPTFAEVRSGAPATAGDRSLLFEESLAYSDLRRLRIAASAFAQRTTGPSAGSVSGVGIDAAWQIAPLLALRTWALVAHANAPGTVGGYPQPQSPAYDPAAGVARIAALNAPSAYPAPESVSAPAPTDRPKLIWLTYEKGIRIDALVRNGPLEGDVRLPLGASAYAVALGSAEFAGRRVTTLGLTLR